MKVNIEKFENIDKFLGGLKRPTNKIFSERRPNDLSSEKGDAKFTGTKNLEEAFNLLKIGYKQPLAQIKEEMRKTATEKTENHPMFKQRLNVCGAIPLIPSSLLGLPNSMIDMKRVPIKSKVLNIVYDISIHAGGKKPEIMLAGTNLLKLCNSLERNGYRINIFVSDLTTTADEKEAISFFFKLKDSKQKLDLLKICFPLVHPSMLRRISFKWLETTPIATDPAFCGGYGRPLTAIKTLQEVSEMLKKESLLKSNDIFLSVKYLKNFDNFSELLKELKGKGIIK